MFGEKPGHVLVYGLAPASNPTAHQGLMFDTLNGGNPYAEIPAEVEKHITAKKELMDSALENGDFGKILEYITPNNRAKLNYMEPLLYAVKNDKHTFIVFKYMDESIQSDINMEIATEIVKYEPELIENTNLSGDKKFIMDSARINPQVIKYMDRQLKTNDAFLQEITNTDNAQIRAEIAKNCDVEKAVLSNPSLKNDMDFINAAIITDVTAIEFASDEIKNNKDFLKEQCFNNEELIEYATDNIDSFGLEGIKGIEEASRSITVDNSMSIIDEMVEKGNDERYSKVKSKIEEKGKDDLLIMKWTTAMVAQRDDVSPEYVKYVLNYSILTMETIKRDLNENGEIKVNLESAQQLITPRIINRLIDKSKAQGFELDSETQKKLDSYVEFYYDYNEKFAEQKRKRHEIENKENKKHIKIEEIEEGISNELDDIPGTDRAASEINAGIRRIDNLEKDI